MPYPDINNYLARITEMQNGILANVTAAPVGIYRQTDYPYWVNDVGSVSVQVVGFGEPFASFSIPVTMRLVRGKWGEGDDYSIQQQCYADLIATIDAFAANPELITATYTEAQLGYVSFIETAFNGQTYVQDNEIGTLYQITITHNTRRL